MLLRLNQTIPAKGYITAAKFLYGSISEIEIKAGYQRGRLSGGFFIAHLQRLPELHQFELAGYSITPEHRFNAPKDLDIDKLKKMARNAMAEHGSRGLVKVFPNTRHDNALNPDDQYPYGQGGIPQWKLTSDMPMHIFKEIPANYKGNIFLN